MSWKSIVITGLLCVVASPVLALPSFIVSNGGLDGSNQIWDIMVQPETAGFVANSSVAVELDLSFTSAVDSFTLNDSFWNVGAVSNPGNNPFTQTMTETVMDGSTLFIAAGSELFTNTDPVLLANVTTIGVGGTASWGGADTGAGYDSSRIAQQSTNYDGITDSVMIPGGLLAGDFDGNGSVGGGDFDLLLANWGKPVPPVPAGWTGSQPTAPSVGGDEFDALLGTWGQSQGAGAVAGAAVPEPAAVFLAAFGGLALAIFRNRK